MSEAVFCFEKKSTHRITQFTNKITCLTQLPNIFLNATQRIYGTSHLVDEARKKFTQANFLFNKACRFFFRTKSVPIDCVIKQTFGRLFSDVVQQFFSISLLKCTLIAIYKYIQQQQLTSGDKSLVCVTSIRQTKTTMTKIEIGFVCRRVRFW